MFPNDDPRVLKGRQRLADEEARSGRVDWARCERYMQFCSYLYKCILNVLFFVSILFYSLLCFSRHLFARVEEELGDKRPLTGWSDSGNTTMPSFAWNEWCNG